MFLIREKRLPIPCYCDRCGRRIKAGEVVTARYWIPPAAIPPNPWSDGRTIETVEIFHLRECPGRTTSTPIPGARFDAGTAGGKAE